MSLELVERSGSGCCRTEPDSSNCRSDSFQPAFVERKSRAPAMTPRPRCESMFQQGLESRDPRVRELMVRLVGALLSGPASSLVNAEALCEKLRKMAHWDQDWDVRLTADEALYRRQVSLAQCG